MLRERTTDRMPISRTLIAAVEASSIRKYRLARIAGCSPATLARWLHGAYEPKHGDPRVIAVGELVGVPAVECFEPLHQTIEVHG